METQTHQTTEDTGSSAASQQPSSPPMRSLVRPREGRMLAGVAAAAADYLGVDVTIVRVAIAVLCLFGGAGIPLYLAGWLLIPEEGAQESIAGELLQYHHDY